MRTCKGFSHSSSSDRLHLAKEADILARLLSSLTYANVMSTLALFVALGGSSYAAIKIGSKQIRDNSVRSADLRNNEVRSRDLRNNDVRGGDIRNSSVTGSDIRDGALTGRDLAPETLDGTRIKNLTAGDFAPGVLPDPVPATLPSGKTMRGVFGVSITGDASDSGVARSPISFPIPLASPPTAEAYIRAGTPSPPQCPGSVADPQATRGAMCVYEGSAFGTIALAGYFDPTTGSNFRTSRFGVVAFINGDAGSSTRGTWAVTAP